MSYESRFWLTYRQAQELGGNVHKGEKACPVVFWKQLAIEDKETGEEDKIPLLRFYHVFNISQCEGLKDIPAIAEIPVPTDTKPNAIVGDMPQRPAIRQGMSKAFYSPSEDVIGIPLRERFENRSEEHTSELQSLRHL